MTQVSTFGGMNLPPEAPAQSAALAVFSLVLGCLSVVGCCVPGWGVVMGPLAATCGFIVLRRGEAARGRGAALGGVVTGLLGVVAGVVVLLGAALMMLQAKGWATTVGEAITTAQGGDASVLKQFTVQESGPLTDEQVTKFADRVQAKLGKFQRAEGGVLRILPLSYRFLTEDQARAQRLQGKYAPFVYPVQFENGRGGLVMLMKAGEPPNGGAVPPLSNIGVFQEGSTEIIWLALPEP